MIKTIIFDLDGVLVDTKKIHFDAKEKICMYVQYYTRSCIVLL